MSIWRNSKQLFVKETYKTILLLYYSRYNWKAILLLVVTNIYPNKICSNLGVTYSETATPLYIKLFWGGRKKICMFKIVTPFICLCLSMYLFIFFLYSRLKEVCISSSDSQKRNLRRISKKLIPNAKRHTFPKSHGQQVSGGKCIPGTAVPNVEKWGADKPCCLTAFSALCTCAREVVDEHPAVLSTGICPESGELEQSRLRTGSAVVGRGHITRFYQGLVTTPWNMRDIVPCFPNKLLIWLHTKWLRGCMPTSPPPPQEVFICWLSRLLVILEYFFLVGKFHYQDIFRDYQEFIVSGPEKKRPRSKQTLVYSNQVLFWELSSQPLYRKHSQWSSVY